MADGICGSPFPLPVKWYPLLFTYVVKSLNSLRDKNMGHVQVTRDGCMVGMNVCDYKAKWLALAVAGLQTARDATAAAAAADARHA